MFSNSKYSGKHMICDIQNISNIELLNNTDKLKEMMKEICYKYNYKILEEVDYNFTPEGCTILFLLSESHMSIHTFPEKQHIAFDIYTCRTYDSNQVYNEIFDYLILNLSASNKSICNIINRIF